MKTLLELLLEGSTAEELEQEASRRFCKDAPRASTDAPYYRLVPWCPLGPEYSARANAAVHNEEVLRSIEECTLVYPVVETSNCAAGTLIRGMWEDDSQDAGIPATSILPLRSLSGLVQDAGPPIIVHSGQLANPSDMSELTAVLALRQHVRGSLGAKAARIFEHICSCLHQRDPLKALEEHLDNMPVASAATSGFMAGLHGADAESVVADAMLQTVYEVLTTVTADEALEGKPSNLCDFLRGALRAVESRRTKYLS